MANRLFPLERIGNRSVQRIVCSTCGEWDRNTWGEQAADETLVAFFRRRGWTVDEKRGSHVCKVCADKATSKKREEEARKRMEKVVQMSPPPSPDSAFAKKIMSDLLFEHYDLSARDYKPGWTDARIAKEAGLSEVFVAQRRAADYGPISPPKPPILQNASNAVGHMATAIRDIAASAGALQTKSEALIKTAERLLADLAEAQKSKGAA
jgi:hypothetical protein